MDSSADMNLERKVNAPNESKLNQMGVYTLSKQRFSVYSHSLWAMGCKEQSFTTTNQAQWLTTKSTQQQKGERDNQLSTQQQLHKEYNNRCKHNAITTSAGTMTIKQVLVAVKSTQQHL